MKRSLFYLLAILSIGLGNLPAGCAKLKPMLADIKGSIKGDGEQPASPLDQTRKRHSCAQDDTRLFIEKAEVSPGQVEQGDKIEHVVQYALCAPSDAVTIQGMITRKIKFKGREVKISTDADTETFKAGTWTVTAFIEVPDKAPVGVYTLETTIRYENKTITRSGLFRVLED